MPAVPEDGASALWPAPTSRPRGRPAKLHQCPICQRRFKRNEHLTRHLRRHTKEKPYQCRQCLMCFTRKELHNRHQQKQHHAEAGTIPPPLVITPTASNDLSLLAKPNGSLSFAETSGAPPAEKRPGNFSSAPPSLKYVTPGPLSVSPRGTTGPSVLPPSASPGQPSPLRAGQPGYDRHSSSTGSTLEDLSFWCSQLPLAETPSEENDGAEDALLRNALPSIESSDHTDNNSYKDSNTSDRALTATPGSRSALPGDPASLSPNLDFLTMTGFPPWIVSAFPSRATSVAPNDLAPPSNHLSDHSSRLDIEGLFGPPSADELQVVNQLRSDVLNAVNHLRAVDHNQMPYQHNFSIPEARILDNYQKMYFAIPNKNLPFTHSSSPILENLPAVNLALLADGAMYCGDYQAGTFMFEASRRLVAHHLEAHTPPPVPLWVLNTLLTNSVFGLPGGDDPSIDITIGSLESLLWLASQVEYSEDHIKPTGEGTVEQEWRHFVRVESRKRTLLCVLVMVGLWSAAYGPIRGATKHFYNYIPLPCPEVLWSATSAEQWKGLSAAFPNRPPRLQETIDQLVAGEATRCSGLSSLCLIVGLLLYADDLRGNSSMSPEELGGYLQLAVRRWAQSHDSDRRENTSANYIAYPAASYLEISFQVDIRAAMAQFIRYDFASMRAGLRQGHLRVAAMEGLSALVPWAACHKNQISMVSIPCALVVMECALMLLEQPFLDPADATQLKKIQDTIGLSETDMHPRGIWIALRKIIENGPVTFALLSALEAYSQILPGSDKLDRRLSATSPFDSRL